MTDTQWRPRINGTAPKLSGNSLESYGAVMDRSVVTWESQAWRSTYAFFEGATARFKTRAERNLDAPEELVEQVRKKQDAGQNLILTSADAYADFLDSMFFYYRENARAAEWGTREA